MNTQAKFAAALLDPACPCPSGLKTWTGGDPARRFQVYRNNVVASLIDALADTFPVTLELVGDTFFRAMAGVFVRGCPPRSPILAFYGDDFPVQMLVEPLKDLVYGTRTSFTIGAGA